MSSCVIAHVEFSDNGDKQIPLSRSLTFCKNEVMRDSMACFKAFLGVESCSEIIWDLQSEAEDTSVRCVNLLELLRVSAAQFSLENGRE